MNSLQAVVLAAGDGDRMHPLTSEMPKSLLPLAGRPIIAHVLDALSAAGVARSTIVVGYRGEQIRDALAGAAPPDMTLDFVENGAYMLGNARSIWAARDAVTGSFLLVMADHWLDASLPRALTSAADERCRLAVEYVSAGDGRAADATRALVRDGRVADLGKHLTDWNALDTGAFWCTSRVFDAMTPDLRDGEASAVFASLARAGELDAADVTGCAWLDIDTKQDLRLAESMLARIGSRETLAARGGA